MNVPVLNKRRVTFLVFVCIRLYHDLKKVLTCPIIETPRSLINQGIMVDIRYDDQSQVLVCDTTCDNKALLYTTTMASNKPNKLAFLSMPAPASYVAGLGRG